MTFAERGGWWIIAQIILVGLYALAIFGTGGIDEGIGLGFARIVGVVMVAVAAVVGGWATVLLGRNFTIYPDPVDGATLVDTGPYRLVRHPIYFAIVLGSVGLGLAMLNTAAVAVGLVSIPFFGAMTGLEEDLLIEKVAGYRRYRSAIPNRIIPRLM